MPKGDKYIELTSYLERCEKEELKLLFAEIESILGCKLLDAAYKNPALWSNSESHSIAFGWLNAGYITRNVDVSNKQVEFVKTGTTPQPKEKSRKWYKPKERIRHSNLPVENAVHSIEEYMYENENVVDTHGRFLSWVHCYNIFVKLRGQR